MPIAVLAPLLAQYGLPLVQQVFALYNRPEGNVTQAEFDALVKLAAYRSSDALAEQGIKIADGKVVPL